MPYPAGPVTLQEIRRAARTAINIFERQNMTCCLFGSLACHVYCRGRSRNPGDADLVVLDDQGHDTDSLKRILVDKDDRFYLVDSSNPRAKYKLLFFAPTGAPDRYIKVDILTIGISTTLNIPEIPRKRITYVAPFTEEHNHLPLMPLLALLLMKLQGWCDNRHSRSRRKWQKVPRDVEDIDALVEIALNWEVHLDNKKERWMPHWFVKASRKRVKEYLKKFPQKRDNWEALGF